MSKKSLATEIRGSLEGLPCPICTKGITDQQLCELSKQIDNNLLLRFGTCDVKTNDKVNCAWWEELENIALGEYNMQYYEDMEE